MASPTIASPVSPTIDSTSYQQSVRPPFVIGQHDSSRRDTLSRFQYRQVLDAGFNFTTTPITNRHFYNRVLELCHAHLQELEQNSLTEEERANPSLPGPIIPTLTDEDTTLFPSSYVGDLVAYASPWIDLCSDNALISSLSRQILNLEVAYANFCGCRSVIVPGPRSDHAKGVAQYGRAIQEAFQVAGRVSFIIHLPMYREPGLEEKDAVLGGQKGQLNGESAIVDVFSSWDSWHSIRTICNYSVRLFVALKIPRRLPEMELQTRWFAEPLHYLTFGPKTFHENRMGYPTLSRHHQDMINMYMRLKNAPWMMIYDCGPELGGLSSTPSITDDSTMDYPTLSEAHSPIYAEKQRPRANPHASYLKYLERQQEPFTQLENSVLTSFQDWLQSPLQPLSDNLESSTYEMFEGDPVKYDQYEKAITEAMAEWKELNKPTSSMPRDGNTIPELVVAVAGAGRGPLVTRVLRASEKTGMPIQLWALEKNQNAYVYLLRQNKLEWDNKVHVVKTDMREWPGPIPHGHPDRITTVDILVTELLGSFGDNELSPECLDGIQRHLARPHGLSIPHSYTAHLSPISYPRVYADLTSRVPTDPNAFETPWVIRLFAIDFLAHKVPTHARFQQAWEFIHPVRLPFAEEWEAAGQGIKKMQRGGGGAMHLSAGLNEHNTRHCHLTFVCRARGAMHGLAGYFESVLYRPQVGGRELVEISTLPEEIDKKSKDMVSWFPIFFPLKHPLYFPQDAEIEVSMWRQTDDTKVWYEWLVEVFAWVGPDMRVKVGTSELHSSRKVACLM